MLVKDWLGEDNKIGIDIWHKKYQHGNETFDEWLDRVSGGKEDVKKLIKEKKFLFGGRTLANRGTDTSGSYFNCFEAGMKVITKRGFINIEDVVVGDEVIAEDNQWHIVNDVMKREYEGDIYVISSNYFPCDIRCTPNHRFLTQHGWRRADELQIDNTNPSKSENHFLTKIKRIFSQGDFLKNELTHVSILNIAIEKNIKTTVYNLSVEDVHSYTVNGVVVHNCYSRGFVDDDYAEIMQAATDIGLTFKSQGGQGISLSKLRPKGTPIKKEYYSDGIIPFMKIYNEVTAGTSQGGSRKGALMLSIDARHKEAEAFITIKSKEGEIEKANLSLEVDDPFMWAVEEYYETGKKVVLHEKRNYSGHLVEYDITPIDIFKLMAKNCWSWGDPACLYVNRFRNYNLMEMDDEYQIETSNP